MVQMICGYSAVVYHFKLLCVLPEGILIKQQLDTPLLPVGTLCMLSDVTQRKGAPGACSDTLLTS